MAQLDQLGFAKEVAQHASVIGHEFSLSLLARIMGRSLDELMPMLDSLIDSRIVVRGSSSPDGYWFKHALIRDISYRSLLRKNRRQIHLAVAQGIVPSSGGNGRRERRSDRPALFAGRGASGSHQVLATRRRRGDRTIGQRRGHRDAAIGARRSWKNCTGRSNPALELDLVLTQAMALRSVRGYSAAEVEQRLARARVLCTVCGDFSNRFSVEWGLFQCTFVKGDIDGARAFAADLVEHAGHDPGAPLVDAYLANGMVAFTPANSKRR